MSSLNNDIYEYVKNLGLDHLKWLSVSVVPDDSVNFVLLITKSDDQLWLEFGKDAGGGFMTADDLSFCGPVRNVVAWASISSI